MLLILAGVSISLVVGENGVLTQATGASDTTKIAQMKEAMGLAMSSCQADYFNAYANNASATITNYISPSKFSDALDKQGYKLVKAPDTSMDATTDTTWTATSDATLTYYIYSNESTNKDADHLKVIFQGTDSFSVSVKTYGTNLKGN
ncbi:MAG: hypothetical protein IJ867_00480 [Clostridia bacterium]|nr:hypothetical protein [Clostridia bacterium]